MRGFIILLSLIIPFYVSGQQSNAEELMNKALARLESDNYAIHFESIAYSATSPTAIFSLPVYKVFKGGYLYHDMKKFEMNFGKMKAVCDGKIMAMIDDESKSMVIDSMRENLMGKTLSIVDLEKAIGEEFKTPILYYQGKEVLKGKSCHKIKAEYKEDPSIHSYYFITEKEGQIMLLSDYHDNAYDSYWIRKIGAAPENYVYEIDIPKKEVDKLFGYEVFDMRFTQSDLMKKQ